MESVPSLLPKGLSYLLYKDKNQGKDLCKREVFVIVYFKI